MRTVTHDIENKEAPLFSLLMVRACAEELVPVRSMGFQVEWWLQSYYQLSYSACCDSASELAPQTQCDCSASSMAQRASAEPEEGENSAP